MSELFNIETTPLEGLMVATLNPYTDIRGSFTRLFCSAALRKAGVTKPAAQINLSVTASRGAVRGLHYQSPPHAEMKLVTCLQGRIFDVAADLRIASPTYLKWHGVELSEDNKRMAVIPEGFAHGFQTLTDDCMLLYLHTAPYSAESEGGLSPIDSTLGIDWPAPVEILSERDRNLPHLAGDFKGL